MGLQKVGCGYMDWIGLAQDKDRWWTLVSVVWSWIVSCVHCVKVTESNSNLHTVHKAYDPDPHNHSPQPAQPVQNTICSNTRSCSPDDGHNDDRNMLR